MPVTHFTMLIGCLAIAGIPPFSGFFSKDEILVAAYAVNPIYYYIGLGGALMTAFYMFRLYAMTFMGTHRSDMNHHHPHESPMEMTVPLIVLAILATVGGFLGVPELFAPDSHWLSNFLAPVFKQSADIATEHAHVSHSTEWMLLALSVGLIIAMIVWAISKFSKYQATEAEETGFGKVLENKWYVDELYDAVIVKPLLGLGSFFNTAIEKSGIDKAVNGVGKLVQYGSRKFRLVQSGNVGNYVLMMVVSVILLIWMVFYLRY